jgi:hypothetical protein
MAVLELDVACGAARSASALTLLRLPGIGPAAAPETEADGRYRDDRHAITLDRRPEDARGAKLRADPLG